MVKDVALITGASSGIGEALARRIARAGRPVALVARRQNRLEKLAAELRKTHRVEAHVLPMDLTQPGGAKELVEEAERRGLIVDWLVNNAGFGSAGRFDQLPLEREVGMVQLNIRALVELTHRFLPAMVSRRSGVVINVASIAGFLPSPYMATYSATKAFVLSFTEAIAVELRGTNVQVLCVCPGVTRTEFQTKASVRVNKIPNFLWMTPEKVADQVVRAVGRRTVLVNGGMNRLTVGMMRFLPRGLLASMAGRVLKLR